MQPLDPAQPLSGLLIDEWVEVVPNARETTAIAFQFNPPDACAPQAWLLAVPPVPDRAWTRGDLHRVLLETLDLAKLRAVDAEALGELGHYLPATAPRLQRQRRRRVHRLRAADEVSRDGHPGSRRPGAGKPGETRDPARLASPRRRREPTRAPAPRLPIQPPSHPSRPSLRNRHRSRNRRHRCRRFRRRPRAATPSITSWTRLEPRCRDADMRAHRRRARLRSAVAADAAMADRRVPGRGRRHAGARPRARARSPLLSRCHLGELPPNTQTRARALRPARALPLEVMVERAARCGPAVPTAMLPSCALAVEAGLHFLRMLERSRCRSNYRAAFIARYRAAAAGRVGGRRLDDASARFAARRMAGRAPDARRLAAALRGAAAAATRATRR